MGAVAKPAQKLELPADVASCSSARRFVQVALTKATEELRGECVAAGLRGRC